MLNSYAKASGLRSSKPMNLPFGKYKGTPLHQLPADYFAWLCSLELRDQKLRLAIEDERHRRIFLEEHPGSVNPRLVDEIVGAGLRSLAKKFHPDHGGSHEQMQMINVAADWLRSQAREALP